MRQILKSYLKAYFKNWIEAIGLILFIVIIVATFAGVLSGALQFKIIYNNIANSSQEWDFYFTGRSPYKAKFIQDYYLNNIFVNQDGNVETVTDSGDSIIDKNSEWWVNVKKTCANNSNPANRTNCEDLAITKKLNDVYQNQGKMSHDGLTPSGVAYLGKFNYNRWNELLFRILKSPRLDWGFAISNELIAKSTKNDNLTLNFVPTPLIDLTNSKVANFNQLHLFAGQLPGEDNTIAVSSLFAKQHNLSIGSEVSLGDNAPSFTVSGIASTLNTMLRIEPIGSNHANTSGLNNYGVIYLPQSKIYQLLGSSWVKEREKALDYVFSTQQMVMIKLNNSDPETLLSLKKALGQVFVNPSGTLLSFNESGLAVQMQNINLQIILYAVMGSVLLGLGFIFINYAMKKEMNKTRRQIGIFKAFGYRTAELAWVFTVKFFITMLLGALVGYAISLPIQMYVNKLYTIGLLVPFDLIYIAWWFLVLLFVAMPVLFTVISFGLILLHLKLPSLDLINLASKKRITFFETFLKTITVKAPFLFRLQLSFMMRTFSKWLIVMVIFFISSLLFILQFNASDIFKQLTVRTNLIYQNSVDHKFDFGTKLTASEVKNIGGHETLQLLNVDNFRLIPTLNAEQTAQESLQNFHSLVQSIIEGGECKDLAKFASYQPIYQSIYFDDLLAIIKFVKSCGAAENLPGWLTNIEKLSSQLDQTKVKTIISFNQLMYNPTAEALGVTLPVSPSENEQTVIDDITIKGLSQTLADDFYYLPGISENVINEVINFSAGRTNIPAIISKKIAKLANLNVNDHYQFVVKNAIGSFPIAIVVKGIINDDTIRRNIFISEQAIQSYYRDAQGAIMPSFYNNLLSKNQLIQEKINLKEILMQKQSFKVTVQNLTINLFNQDLDVTIGQLLTNNFNAADVASFTNLNNVTMINLERLLLAAGMELFNNSLLILQVLNGLIIFIILAVVTTSVIDEASDIILTMRALGYRTRDINFIVIGNYILGIIFAFFAAYLLSLLIWHFVLAMVFTNYQLVINLPLNWQTPVLTGTIIATILGFAWVLAMYLIKKRKLQELTI
ncbi:ABC transporter permease [Spiroplasma syrphidicola EA-1]|uniref:ABC transporter permease n=1 Tax=Spiroplasma syrphidicola EA-1 TaxID=1276229 RepID=R4U6N0_9MOLU|nr:ABC transporter permease [Spiroplasma syrphidicola]AGM26273.1 ABC transporter permease [Spiroplasma syrphidicola EA-1]